MNINDWMRQMNESGEAQQRQLAMAATPIRWEVTPDGTLGEGKSIWYDEMMPTWLNEPKYKTAQQWQKEVMAAQVRAYQNTPAPQQPEITSELVENAIERINTDGWTQRNFHDGGGAHCAIGALGDLAVSAWQYRSVRHAVLTWERELMDLMGIDPDVWPTIPTWNDAEGRTKDEVLDALMTAAKKLREMGR